MEYSVPRSPVTLTSATYALLGLGELKYVLGAGAWTEARNIDRDNERLDAFIARLRTAYDETGDNALAACLRFYESPPELTRAREAFQTAATGSYVGLSVEGKVLTDREVVQVWPCGGRGRVPDHWPGRSYTSYTPPDQAHHQHRRKGWCGLDELQCAGVPILRVGTERK